MTRTRKCCWNLVWPIAIGLAVAIVGSVSQADYIPPNLLHYQMDEASWNGTADEVKDSSSGTKYHGTAVGNATTVAGGISGRAGTFDRNGDYVDCGNDTDLIPTTTDEITLEAWINLASSGGGSTEWKNERFIIGRQHAYSFYVGHYGDGIGRLKLGVTGTTNPSLSVTDVDMADYIGTWTHVVGTYNGSTMKLYINGEEEASQDSTGEIVPIYPDRNTYVGYMDQQRYFDGQIDEAGIYDYALTPTQVKANYDALIPEPSTVTLLAMGVLVFGLLLWRRRR